MQAAKDCANETAVDKRVEMCCRCCIASIEYIGDGCSCCCCDDAIDDDDNVADDDTEEIAGDVRRSAESDEFESKCACLSFE